MKKRNRNTAALGADAEKRYGAIADAARQTHLASGWDRAIAKARGPRPPSTNGVKLHTGWDAAFRRARGS